MKYIIIAIAAIAISAQAADIDVQLGAVTVKDTHQPDVLTWLATQAPLTEQVVEVVDGVTQTNTVVVAEEPKAKATRCMRAVARQAIKKAVRDVKQANAVHEAKQAEVFEDVAP